MTRRLGLCLALIGAAGAAMAQAPVAPGDPAPVATGDPAAVAPGDPALVVPGDPAQVVPARLLPAPDGSRRLVLTPWTGDGWSAQQYQNLVEIRLPDTVLAIDLGGVALPGYNGALVELATAVDGTDTLVRFVLGCDCRVDISEIAPGRLALDILEGAAGPETGTTEGAAPVQSPLPVLARGRAPAQAEGAAPTGAAPDAETVRARLLAQLERAAQAGLVTLRPEHQPSQPVAPAAPEPAEPPAAPTELAAAPDPTPPQAAAPAAAPAPAPDTAPAAAPGETAAAAPATTPDGAAEDATDDAAEIAEATPGLRPASRQSVIRPTGERPAPVYLPETAAAPSEPAEELTGPADLLVPGRPPVCLDDAALTLSDPLPTDEATAAIAALNRRLLGEFDRVDPSVAETLARVYLSQGLGVEAEVTLADFARATASAPILAALARLVEDRPLAPGHILSAADCAGVHAVWQALAHSLAGETAAAVAAEARSGRAIEALPRSLRARIAARVGLDAVVENDLATARRLQALAARSLPRQEDPGLIRLLEARLHRAEGAPDAALSGLRRLRHRPDALGALATLDLADMVIAGELPGAIGSALLRADLGALAQAYQGDPLGPRAFGAEAALVAMSDGRTAALDLLAYGLARGLTDQAGYVDGVRRIGAGAVGGDDTPLAVLYDADPGRFQAALAEPSFRIALAKSYADIGAPDLGRDLLTLADLAQPDMAEALARAWLSAGELDKAALAVTPLAPGPIRAGIEAAIADARGAASALIALNQDPGAPDPAWQSRVAALEQQLADQPDPERATRAALLQASLGASEMSPAASRSLQGTDPELGARLQQLFGAEAPAAPRADAAAVPAYLDDITQETELFKDLLNDG